MEWEMDFRVPVKFTGTGAIVVRGYTPVTEDRDAPTDDEIDAMRADAKASFNEGSLRHISAGSFDKGTGWLDFEADDVTPDWTNSERMD